MGIWYVASNLAVAAGAIAIGGMGGLAILSGIAAPPPCGPRMAPNSDTSWTTVSPSTVAPTRNARAGLPSTAISAIPSLAFGVETRLTGPGETTPTSLKRSALGAGKTGGSCGDGSTRAGRATAPSACAAGWPRSLRNGASSVGSGEPSAHTTATTATKAQAMNASDLFITPGNSTLAVRTDPSSLHELKSTSPGAKSRHAA
jgi:hypothetical protein